MTSLEKLAALQDALVEQMSADANWAPAKEYGSSSACLRRHEQPHKPTDPLGDVVPRQAVDPGRDFDPDQTEGLIQDFLTHLDPTSNVFLNSPDDMLEQLDDGCDFSGTPYSFDIRSHRANNS